MKANRDVDTDMFRRRLRAITTAVAPSHFSGRVGAPSTEPARIFLTRIHALPLPRCQNKRKLRIEQDGAALMYPSSYRARLLTEGSTGSSCQEWLMKASACPTETKLGSRLRQVPGKNPKLPRPTKNLNLRQRLKGPKP